jgi:glycogen debranching enzyme
MTDLSDRLIVKDGNVFAVVPRDGGWSGADGVWMDDVRHVSRQRVLIDGREPAITGAAEHDTAIVHHLQGGGRVERRIHADGRLTVDVRTDGTVEIETEGDFVSILGLRDFGPPGPRAGHRTERTAPGEWRFTPTPVGTYDWEPPPVDTGNDRLDTVMRRALADMRMLISTLDGEPYFAAGIPWYATLFGRDSLIAALQMQAYAPDVLAGTLRLLAGRIGTVTDAEREEEPGKILHELRPGETGTPFARYYGSVDATPLFLLAVDRAGMQHELAGAVAAARAWVARRDPLTYTAGAVRHQGWKDSEDGVPVDHPVALIEPQAYAGRDVEPFWLPERAHYAMALGTPVLASNQGHALWAGQLPPERARAVRDALMGPAMFTGWGIRTLASSEPLYDPLSYHLGSVWPHDTALAAAGLLRHGFADDFLTIFDALVDAAWEAPGHRLPELFGGHPRVPGEPFVAYPVACRPQAWAAGAIPYLFSLGESHLRRRSPGR